MLASPTGNVLRSSPLIMIEANMYSVQEIIKQKIDTLAIPGRAKGNIILKRIFNAKI